MNLWLRLFLYFLRAPFRKKLQPPFDVSRLAFRVLPNDLDVNLHMNNGRYLTCVDAPLNASFFFGQIPACDQMLSCVRPHNAAFTRRGPVWRCADWVQIAYAHFRSAPSDCWFSQSRINDRLPLPVLRSAHIPDTTRMAAALRGCQRIPINATLCHQGPSDPRHFICKCDRNQHHWLSRQHLLQP